MGAFRDWLDDLAFRARGMLRWSAPVWVRPAGSFDRPIDGEWSPEAQRRLAELRQRYDLTAWPRLLSRAQLHENLYVLDVLASRLGPPPAGAVTRGLDVGARDGVTLPARFAARPGSWDLVELDAHRRYLDLSTRAAHGRRFARAFPGCRYLAGTVTDLTGPYDLITWFLPFVRLRPLRSWGLPPRFFEPTRLLRHVRSLLAPGGTLIVVNQGDIERDAQARLLATFDMDAPAERLQSPLSPFQRARYIFRWTAGGDRPSARMPGL